MICIQLLNLKKQQAKCFLLMDKFTVENKMRANVWKETCLF